MKKILVMSIALVLMAGSAFAFTANSADGKLSFGTSVDNTSLESGIGLSPKVVAYYVTDGTDTVTSQWYGASTVHPGGNMAYATAQNLNNIMHAAYQTGDDTAAILSTIPNTAASKEAWPATWTVD